MSEKNNACKWWDFTGKCEIDPEDQEEMAVDAIEMKEMLDNISNDWCYQIELGGKTKYLHYQGRICLKDKHRLTALKKILPNSWHLSNTSEKARKAKDPFAYCKKEDTRVSGPYMSKALKDALDAADPNAPLPREKWPKQIRHIEEFYPWQQQIIDSAKEENFDARTVNVLIDTAGNHGKSSLKSVMAMMKIAQTIPYRNDYRDVMRIVMSAPKRVCYLVDLPRALKKEEMRQFVSGMETLKDGYAFDDRYKFQDMFFDSPCIWIFSNVIPDISLLTKGRWKIWEIEDNEDPTTCHLEEIKLGSARFKELLLKGGYVDEPKKYKSKPTASKVAESDSDSVDDSPPRKVAKMRRRVKETSDEDANDERFAYPNIPDKR